MRSRLTYIALLFVSAVVMDAGPCAAKQREPSHRPIPLIHIKDGLFTTNDGGVTCKVSRGWINCVNGGRAQITCLNDKCSPHHIASWPPEDLAITSQDDSKPRRVLPPYVVNLMLPRLGCQASAHVIECRAIDYNGGFQMDHLFARCSNWDDAPSGWPWDGRKHGKDELILGV